MIKVRPVYLADRTMITSIGPDVQSTLEGLGRGVSGVAATNNPRVTDNEVMAGEIRPETYSGVVDFESLAVECVRRIRMPHGGRNVLIVATAKGNVAVLADGRDAEAEIARSVKAVADKAGFDGASMSVSNACISGVSAMIAGKRLVAEGIYDNALVVGVDVLSRFITSGFASFKSLSTEHCRPYDTGHCGLNLGEAAAAVLLVSDKALCRGSVPVRLAGCGINDDANHISGPSRTGDGLAFAIRQAMSEAEVSASDISFLQMHGTATVYNDEMECKAAALCGLSDVPCQSLKSYFGHTMGASGVLETIICAEELLSGEFYGVQGFTECCGPAPLNVSADSRHLEMRTCVKTASGFGGCNAAVVLSLEDAPPVLKQEADIRVVRKVEYSGEEGFATFVRERYHALGESNLKFFKMDDCSKLAYVASCELLQGLEYEPVEMGMILSGRYGSMDTDKKHQAIISAGGDASSSPAVFVYTLPNVPMGEVSIRHHIKGEMTYFPQADCNLELLRKYASIVMRDSGLRYCIVGWLDYYEGSYHVMLDLFESMFFKFRKCES